MKRHNKGFTLLEMILVLAIMSAILLMIASYTTQRFNQFRRDKTAMQMQQVLNAGLAYYTSNGTWPTLAQLQTGNYIPSTYKNPYGNNYSVTSTTSTFTASTTVETAADAGIISGMLPTGSVTTTTTVNSSVVVPGQNLNNARSVNFANIYNTGGCVPVPTCPTGMQPVIMTAVAAVTGYYDAPSNCTGDSCTPSNPYPIYGVVSYATGGTSTTPPSCSGSGSTTCYSDIGTSTWPSITSGPNYWRVCLSVQVQNGFVSITEPGGGTATPGTGVSGAEYWGQNLGSILVVTRCAPGATGSAPTENQGSNLNVWSN